MSAADERWARVERLYHEALEQAPEARRAYLDQECGGDRDLRAEIDSLLAYDGQAAQFLTRPALETVAARLPDSRVGALVGTQIHGYEIRELLGAGGMSEVYRATDLRLGRDVALKILQRTDRTDPGYLRRFEDEARSASVLNHPNIVTIYGVGEDHDIRYIAMECVAGRTLTRVIADEKPALHLALDLAEQLADALAAAHDKGIIHRDLKPDNVMVTSDDRLKVLDFGIAKREGTVDHVAGSNSATPAATGETEVGQILGTVGYMSPEQAEGRRASAASDQFSFGAILYELLSGRRAFARPTRQATLDAIKRDHPEPIVVSQAVVRRPLRKVLERCLAKDPADRYATSRDLARELRAVRERVRGRLSRRQVIYLGTAATVAIGAAATLSRFLWRQEPRVRALALLPFDNATSDPNVEHLANGLTETLIFRIGVLPSIRVMPHTLVSNFSRSGLDARAFAQSIDADSYLTGNVTRQNGQLTIATSLVEVVTGKQLWSNSFTRPDTDVQAVQEAIATEIVSDGIQLQLSDDDRNRLVRRTTDNAEAYELYLKALLVHERQTFDDILRERELLSRAIALDSKFARAYAALAGTYTTSVIEGYEPPRECWPKVISNVRLAVSRDPDLPDSYGQTALWEFFFNWNWAGAEEGWRMALRSPGAEMYPPLRVGKALQEFALGRTGEAVRTMAEIRKIDRLSPVFVMKEALYLREDNQLEKAAAGYEAALRAMPESTDPWWGLVDVRCAQGRYDDAISICRKLLATAHPDLDRILAGAQGEDGYKRIERELSRLKLLNSDIREKSGYYIAPIDRARAAALLGDSTLAFKYLHEAFEARDPGVVLLKTDRAWTALRDHATFQAAVRQLQMP